MHRKIKNRWIVIEDSLRAVAVMNVPIENRNAIDFFELLLRITSSDGHIIEETEAHRAIRRGMVSRRAHGNERILRRAFNQRINRATGRAGAAQRSFQ